MEKKGALDKKQREADKRFVTEKEMENKRMTDKVSLKPYFILLIF